MVFTIASQLFVGLSVTALDIGINQLHFDSATGSFSSKGLQAMLAKIHSRSSEPLEKYCNQLTTHSISKTRQLLTATRFFGGYSYVVLI